MRLEARRSKVCSHVNASHIQFRLHERTRIALCEESRYLARTHARESGTNILFMRVVLID